jgi:hypothetical protein
LDECSLWEIDNIIDNIPYTDRNMWESQRLVTYTIAKANFKGINKITDFLPLPWEKTKNKPKQKGDTSISNEDVERLRKLAKSFEKYEK